MKHFWECHIDAYILVGYTVTIFGPAVMGYFHPGLAAILTVMLAFGLAIEHQGCPRGPNYEPPDEAEPS